jgi:hypothetical protein
MSMPPCGTFHYAGLVPAAKTAWESGGWTLDDQSGAAMAEGVTRREGWKFWKPVSPRDDALHRLRDNRLIGLTPTLRLSNGHLILDAASRDRAQVASASLELDRSLIEIWRSGDTLTLRRTGTADIGISIVRLGQLIMAVGAVTVIPMGNDVIVRGGPVLNRSGDDLESWPRRDTWVDASVLGETRRLRGGEATTMGHYAISVVRCFEDGVPGSHESLAISLDGACAHEAALHSAALLARPNAGLVMTNWS